MKAEHKDFIGIYDDVYVDGYCEHMIEQFDKEVSKGIGWDRQSSENAKKHHKNDLSMEGRSSNIQLFNDMDCADIFFDGLQYCYNEYVKEYSTLYDSVITSNWMKMQRTSPGGGYHIWHFENGTINQSTRILTYILYLNTLETTEAGETEFLYQRMRLHPIKNRMIIWPASFTHTHRGNVVHGEKNKYIITGWFHINS